MENLQGIINRYKDQLPSYHRCPTGFLAWGGKDYYEINSDKPLSLNATSNGFILNEKGEVQLYDISKRELVKRHYYEDDYHEIETEKVTEHYWDEEEAHKWWGKTLDNYYPWPWYPEKEIEAFEVVRIIPFYKIGDVLYRNDDTEENYELGGICWNKEDALRYPEFFKPIYK